MPTYEYKCNKCREHFDFFQKISDEPIKVCPSCGGELKRLISGGLTPIFKGSGFYETDYKKRSSSGSSHQSSSASKSTSTTSEKKSDKKSSDKANAA